MPSPRSIAPGKIANVLISKFIRQPSDCQKKAIESLSRFLSAPGILPCMVLRGYAGTGKTTLLGHLVDALDAEGIPYCLMAPTGRAAKVLALYSGRTVKTIHSEIYSVAENGVGGLNFRRKENRVEGTLFILDEASMIGMDPKANDLFEGASLLWDLMDYVRQGRRNRLLFVGDRAQLPPVREEESPALDETILSARVSSLEVVTLETVLRQAEDSGILANATLVRQAITSGAGSIPPIGVSRFEDMEVLSKAQLVEKLNDLYRAQGMEETMIITHSNRRALHYNDLVRREILHAQEEILPGERLMVCRNSSTWKNQRGQQILVANGELIRAQRIYNRRVYAGFTFVEIEFTMELNPDEVITATAMLDVLRSPGPSLNREDWERLFDSIKRSILTQGGTNALKEKLKTSPYLNALQLKYGYAITCHKAQGGQWHNVLLDLELYPSRYQDPMLLRWVYTALTRAQRYLALIAPPKQLVF